MIAGKRDLRVAMGGIAIVFMIASSSGPFAGGANVVATMATAPFAWSIQTADPSPGSGFHTAVALDPSGFPWISYINSADGTVRVANRSSGTWTSEVVAGPGSFSGDTNIVSAPNGTIEVSYFDEGTRTVEFALKVASGWRALRIDTGFSEGYNRLTLNALGMPAVVYTSFNGSLRYAEWNGTRWSVETVDQATLVSRYPDVAFDSAGRPHIAYYGNGTLLYASKTNEGWTRAVIDPTPMAGLFSRIRVDSKGAAHVAYFASGNGSLMYATSSRNGWERQLIDPDNEAGFDLSLALTGDDRVNIAYYARRAGTLRYAVETSQGWTRETVDDTGVAGWYTGIAVDPIGFPHISYYDWTDNELRYAEGIIGLQVRSLAAAGINATSAALRGELVALGNHSLASAQFALRAVGTTNWTHVAVGNLTGAGIFVRTVAGLTTNAEYEFYAVVHAGNETSTGAIRSFRLTSPAPPSPPYWVFVAVGTSGGVAAVLGYGLYRRRKRRPKIAPRRPFF